MENVLPTILDEVRQTVETTITRWRSSKEKPPFTGVQMAIMALIMSKEPLGIEDTYSWIVKTFSYYSEGRIKGCLRNSNNSYVLKLCGRTPQLPVHVRREICDMLYEFETPVQLQYKGRLPTYTISAKSAERLLADVLPSSQRDQSKRGDFFGLPAELRNVIYEMVFGYPTSGLWLFMEHNGDEVALDTRFRVISRSWEAAFTSEMWESYRERQYTTGRLEARNLIMTKRLQDILSPLLVCKQFYEEAVGTFYRTNHFHFDNLEALFGMLIRLSPERQKHLAHISFRYNGCEEVAPKTFKMLSEIENLRRLDILADEKQWLLRAGGLSNPPKKYLSVMGMDGVPTLRSIRGLETVNFLRNTTFEHVLKPDMLQPKREKKSTPGGKKRKFRIGEEQQANGGKGKKAKAK